MEHIVFQSIMQHVQDHGILSEFQHDFRPGYSFQQDCLEVLCVQEVLVISPDSLNGQETRMCHQHRGEYQTHTSHMVPSMGPIVPDLTSHGWQNQF